MFEEIGCKKRGQKSSTGVVHNWKDASRTFYRKMAINGYTINKDTR